MKKIFRMSPEARNDLKKAGQYFGEIRSTLADEFAEENQKILERVQNTPEQFQVVYKDDDGDQTIEVIVNKEKK